MATITVEPARDELVPLPQPGGPRFVDVPPPPPARHPGYGVGVWGMACVIATESFVFLALFATYFFLRRVSLDVAAEGHATP